MVPRRNCRDKNHCDAVDLNCPIGKTKEGSARTLRVEPTRQFYDWFSVWQDWQSFYEDPVVSAKVEEGSRQNQRRSR